MRYVPLHAPSAQALCASSHLFRLEATTPKGQIYVQARQTLAWEVSQRRAHDMLEVLFNHWFSDMHRIFFQVLRHVSLWGIAKWSDPRHVSKMLGGYWAQRPRGGAMGSEQWSNHCRHDTFRPFVTRLQPQCVFALRSKTTASPQRLLPWRVHVSHAGPTSFWWILSPLVLCWHRSWIKEVRHNCSLRLKNPCENISDKILW